MAVPKGPLDKIDFKEGLIPAVVQDHKSREVLMVAFMNREALQKSLESGETHFWSRSRKKLWRKGESSGHIQKIKAIYADCDQDTLLVEVEQTGVACHTGRPSCFFQQLSPNGRLKARPASNRPETLPSPSQQPPALEALYRTIMERKRNPSSESYTSRLFEGGIDLILKKVGEEAGEFIISAKNRKKKEIIHETADLLYHLWVALGYYDIQVGEVEALLRRRSSQSGLAEKKGRESKKKSPTGGKRAQSSRK